MVGIPGRRSVEGGQDIDIAAKMAGMTWKERQRNRLPLVDLDDNPFCVDRRTNDEWRMMQLHKASVRIHQARYNSDHCCV